MTNNECRPNNGIKIMIDLIKCLRGEEKIRFVAKENSSVSLSTDFLFDWYERYSIEISNIRVAQERERYRN